MNVLVLAVFAAFVTWFIWRLRRDTVVPASSRRSEFWFSVIIFVSGLALAIVSVAERKTVALGEFFGQPIRWWQGLVIGLLFMISAVAAHSRGPTKR